MFDFRKCLRLSIGLFLAVGSWPCAQSQACDSALIESAIDQGLLAIADSFDGERFNDPYLTFVYEKERIPTVGDQKVTYRTLDAFFMVLMLKRAGVDPGPAKPVFRQAEQGIRSLVPKWRQSGIYNLAKRSNPDGIALDTYAILAYLTGDRELANVVKAGLDGDRWLTPDYYRDPEAYRLPADESWAMRASMLAGLKASTRDRVVRRIAGDTRNLLKREKDPNARVILVFHVLELLRDLPASNDELHREFLVEATKLLALPKNRLDTLAAANLIVVAAKEESIPFEALAPWTRYLIEVQQQSGRWRVVPGVESDDGSVFTTLRCVLALQESHKRMRRHRVLK